MARTSDNKILVDAYIALSIQYNHYDTCEVTDHQPNNIILHSQIPSPEKLFIKKDMYDKLSPEAKEIINVILYSPNEILEFLNHKTITKKSVRKYFSKIWMSRWITQKTIKELTKWTNQL